MPEHFDVPFSRIEQAQQHFDRSRFARAVRPEQAKNFAAPDFKIDIIDRTRFRATPEVFEDFGQAAHGDDYLLRGRSRECGLWSLSGDHYLIKERGRLVRAKVTWLGRKRWFALRPGGTNDNSPAF